MIAKLTITMHHRHSCGLSLLRTPVRALSTLQNLHKHIKNVELKQTYPYLTDEDPQLKVASLPYYMNWLTFPSPTLFIRKHYDPLWTLIRTTYLHRIQPSCNPPSKHRILILGTPGIGKTAALNYFLWRALRDPERTIPVLFEGRDKRYYFCGDEVECEDVGDRKLRRKRWEKEVLLLHDHLPGNEPPIIQDGALVVAPVAPDPKISDEFGKDQVLRLWMPLTTRNELLLMNENEFRVDTLEFGRRVELYGPIPRLVFDNDQEDCQERLKAEIETFSFGQDYLNLQSKAQIPADKHGVSWWVAHVNTANLRKPSKISWASTKIFDQIMERYTFHNYFELENYIASALFHPRQYGSEPRREYQKWARFKIASGVTLDYYEFEVKLANDSQRVCSHCNGTEEPKELVLLSETKFSVMKSEPIPTQTYSFLMKREREHEYILYYSNISNETFCGDAAVVRGKTLYLFQMIIGEKHLICEYTMGYYIAEAKRQGLSKVVLIFVVPFLSKFKLDVAEYNKLQHNNSMCSIGVMELRPKMQ